MLMTWYKRARINYAATQIHPFLTRNPLSIESISLTGRKLTVILTTDTQDPASLDPILQKLKEHLENRGAFRPVHILLTAERAAAMPQAAPSQTASSRPHTPPKDLGDLTPHVRHIIAIASGKGGVGKSTVATNLAIALANQGLNIGLLDADIYGPSIPLMMGLSNQKPVQNDLSKKLMPIDQHGVHCMSIGFLTDPNAPMIWRGPMVQSAIIQLLRDVEWGSPQKPIDILIIDLPPGTGDAQLTMAQKIKLDGAIIVSTPQDVALIDARKGLTMFQKTNVPIIGIIENMSIFCCPHCGNSTPIFGTHGAKETAKKEGVPFLGAIPIDLDIRVQGDAGTPFVRAYTDNPITKTYKEIASKIQEKIKGYNGRNNDRS
jgi:ATP-binding protein involved in chromosome partitioning